MSINKQRHYLLNLNRVLIYICSLLGLFLNANVAYVLALTLWIWLPQCLHLEMSFIKSIKQKTY